MTDQTAPSLPFWRMPLWRNVALLGVAQSLANTLQTMGVATTPLVAAIMLGEDRAWATVPLVFTHLGLMTATIPASMIMARIGRRAGFTIGALIGLIAGCIGVLAVYQSSFELLCLTAFVQGLSVSVAWYYRFAAADGAPAHLKARAISLVLFGGVLSGIIGPESAKWAKDLLAPITFAGVYVMYGVMSILLLILLQGLDIAPPTKQEQKDQQASSGRSLWEIMRQPVFIVAVLSSMMGYCVMTVMMAATPLAMLGCGFTFAQSATVIQFHSVAMFAPALFTGHLITRFGVLTIIATGALIQLACALTAMSGIGFGNFLVANVLVGLGWNFCFIGGTTLLTTAYRPAERAKTQAAHDFLEYSATAVVAGLTGAILSGYGWIMVSYLALPMIAAILLGSLWLFLKEGHIAIEARA
jgi:MFS family permease